MVLHSSSIQFANDHPAAEGHFPGNPVIPGALLLDEVIRAVTGRGGEVVIRATKFFRPVRPGETVILQWEAQREGEVTFACIFSEGGDLAVSGVLEVGARDR